MSFARRTSRPTRAVQTAVLALGLACMAGAALAQQYPVKPVKVIVPFGPGTTSDIIGRMVSDRLTVAMGQPFLVENRTGAGGTIGNDFAAKQPADGYTILQLTAAFPIAASVYPNLKYDTLKDFNAVTIFSTSPLALAANMSFPAKSVPELIAYAKANPGRLSFGSLGVGTSHHLTGEKLKLDAGIDMVHVPYKGSGAAHVDLMGGQIQLMFDNIVALMPHFKSGKLRPLAVSSMKRHPLMPDVPSLSEQGVKDFEAVAWFGMAVPAGTPRDIVNRLNAEMVKVLAIPEVRQRLVDGGSEIIGNSPEAADRFIRNEFDRWAKVAKAANIRSD
jgi:tripartite-type tricarboxylate transporter receptor subunit TctC